MVPPRDVTLEVSDELFRRAELVEASAMPLSVHQFKRLLNPIVLRLQSFAISPDEVLRS